jgi:hypothetical protein
MESYSVMQPTDPRKFFLVYFLFMCICAGAVKAQQTAPAVPDAGKASEPIIKGKDALAKPSPQAGQSPTVISPDEDPDKPSLPGAQTVLIPEDKKIPERKDVGYENWSKPELSPGMKSEIVPLGKSDGEGFTRQLISVQWRELDPIDVWVLKPSGVKNPPVILYMYSYPANNNARYKNDQFCQFLTKNGFAAVGFVPAITGQRVHDRPMKDTFVNQLQEGLGTTTHDVQLILNYLAKRGDLDMTRVGIWGDGSGASVAIMAAAVDPRIKVLDLLDPWGDWPEWLAKSSLVSAKERADLLKPESLMRVENLDPVNYLPKLKTQQVRLQYIKNGLTVTPDAVKEKMKAAAPSNVNIVHYDSTQAFITNVAAKGTGFDWIKEKLGPAPESGGQSMTSASPGTPTKASPTKPNVD